MSHRDKSVANMRCEAKRIYNQRRYINKLEKDKEELQQELNKYKFIVEEISKWLEEQKEFIKDIPVFTSDIANNHLGMIGTYQNVLNKIEELEEGVNK